MSESDDSAKPVESDLAIPPGEYLEEVICELGMTKDELARRMGRPATKLTPLFKGDKTIPSNTALQLEKVVGVPAHIWVGLEAEYRLTLARQEEKSKETQMKNEAVLVSKFPYSDLVKAGEIEKKLTQSTRLTEWRAEHFSRLSRHDYAEGLLFPSFAAISLNWLI